MHGVDCFVTESFVTCRSYICNMCDVQITAVCRFQASHIFQTKLQDDVSNKDEDDTDASTTQGRIHDG